MRYRYDLIQEGMVVASVEASTDKQAKQEINHYAMMYGQDGPTKIIKRKTKSK